MSESTSSIKNDVEMSDKKGKKKGSASDSDSDSGDEKGKRETREQRQKKLKEQKVKEAAKAVTAVVKDAASKVPATMTHRNPKMVIDMVVDEVYLNMDSPEILGVWLDKELGEEFAPFRAAFIDNKIDGRAFMLCEERHLKEMCPSARVGEVLRIQSARSSFKRHWRMVKRNEILMKGKGFLMPMGVMAEYILTNSAFKLIYERQAQEVVGKTVSMITSTFEEFIDLTQVVDVDCKTEKRDTVTQVGSFCCKSYVKDSFTRSRVYLDLREGIVADFNTTSATHEVRTKYMSVTLDSHSEGEQLADAITNAVEEDQLMVAKYHVG